MRTIFAMLSIVALVASVRADSLKTYSREDCVALSVEKSAPARTAAIDETIAHSRVKQARSIALPHFSADATYTRLDQLQEVDFGNEVLEMGTLDNYSVDFGVNQLLFSGGKVNAALNAAAISRKYAGYVRAEVESSVVRQTTALFNNILLAQERVAVFNESVALLDKLVSQIETRRDGGDAADFDLLTAQVRYENEIPQLIQASNTLAILRENMRRLIGVEDKNYEIDGKLEYEPLELQDDDLISAALGERPGVRAYEAMSDLLKEDVSSARADLFPSVGGFFTYNGANSYGFVSFGEEKWEWHWNAGVALKWNIWDGDMTRGVLKEKKLAYSKALVDLEDNERAVALEVESALLNIEHAERSVVAARKGIALAEKAMGIASARHESGLSTYLDYTDANVALKQARLQYLISVCTHMNAIADLRYATGIALDADFKRKRSGESDE